MAKHFENIWEEAEAQSFKANSDKDIENILNNIKKQIDIYIKYKSSNIDSKLLFNLKSKKMGEILFNLSHISKLENLNVAACLNTATQQSKIKEIEDDEDVF